MFFCDTKAPLKYLRDSNTSAGVAVATRHVGLPFFAVIVCRKFASVAAFSWHFRRASSHHENAATMNRKVRRQDIAG
jgi:hypothetical protein